MAEQLTIAIDYDDTFTADVDLWTEFIRNAQDRGHAVICVSARRDQLEHRTELCDALPFGVEVLLSYDHPKRDYAAVSGHQVDIWIDDMPESVCNEL